MLWDSGFYLNFLFYQLSLTLPQQRKGDTALLLPEELVTHLASIDTQR